MTLIESTTPSTAANRNTATQMLYDDAYHQAKLNIMRPIGEFMDLVDQRTLATVEDAKLNLGRTRLVFIVLGVALVFMLARTLYLIKAETKEKEQGEALLKSAEVALRKSEQRFRQMFENNAAVLLLIEPDSGAIVDANPAAASFYGYSVEQLRAMRIDQINTLALSEIEAEMARAARQERYYFIFEHRHASGEIRTVEVRSTPITVDARVLLFSIVSDVTEHQRAQQALERNEKLLRESQEAAQIGSYINTLEAGTFESTSFLDEMFGITKDYPHTNEGWVKFMHPDFMQAMHDALLDSINNKKPFDAEYKIIRPSDGAERWMHGLGQITYDDMGKAISLIGTVQDITERKRSEEEIGEQRRFLDAVIDNVDAHIYIKDYDGRYLYVNPAVAHQFGRPVADILGKSDLEILPPDTARQIMELDSKVHLSGVKQASEEMLTDSSGKDRYFWTVKMPIKMRNHPQALIGFSTDITDITELKRLQLQEHEVAMRLERAMLGTVDAVSLMMDQRDPYTAGHQQRVGEIAAEMGLDADTQRGLRVAGAMHDVGKISVPTEILGKPGRISAIEMAIIKTHAQEGYEVLKGIDFPWPVAEVARQHHERIDGYPRGLKGDEIVLEARVLTVADVVEAMASDRPYRPGLGIDKALAEIERGRGTAYDANAVDACLRLFREKGYSIPA
jgi:PAS domain S-box-containing protein